MMKIVLLAFVIFSFTSEAYAEGLDTRPIGLVLDKKSCLDGKWSFFPLPDVDSVAASIEIINSVIDKNLGKKCKLNGLLLGGSITEETLPQLKLGLKVLKSRRNSGDPLGANTLWLDSPGGLIVEAMKIGDVIAENGINAIVTFRGHCYSACVFIYAAAKTRSTGMGDVGIHRPFASEISATSLSYSEYLKKYDALTPILKQYFSKYGVSPALVDSMNIVPSDEIKILTSGELNSYGLGFENVAAKEYDKARTIQICGQAYYDTHLAFHALIESCRKRFGISALDSKDEECWALARQAYPKYSDQFDACKAKKASQF